MFQSQTRSRSTCDASTYVTPPARLLGFNLRREAAPHATSREERCQMPENVFQSQTRSRSTCDFVKRLCCQLSLHVSISDEKPLHMRHGAAYSECRQFTFQSQTRSRSTCDLDKEGNFPRRNYVSISDEKPLHMRLACHWGCLAHSTGFNLRREAAPHATWRRKQPCKR